jgi:tRNA (guanine-N7-)-methyltransferase
LYRSPSDPTSKTVGKNKLKKFDDLSQWSHVFQQANYEGGDHILKGCWGSTFFNNEKPIVLELGCGKGEYTVGLADLYPEKNFVGIDIKGARLWTGAKVSAEKGMKNVAFLRTHIEFISRFFAPGEVAEIWLTFPDPQMKKVRKRLTSTLFMADYQQLLLPDGLIHLKTDSSFMFEYTKEMVKSNDLPVLVQTDDLYHSGWVDKILSIQTFYENQWLQRGLSIKYILFQMTDRKDWIEPDTEIEPDPYRSFGRQARNLEKTKTLSDHP